MMRSMYSGVSGLRVHQTKMDVIGNNISNVNTVGYKATSAQYSESFSQVLRGAGSPQGGLGGTNPQQVGLGANVASLDVNHNKGSAARTDKPLDLMIDGNGFYCVTNDPSFQNRYFTRAGNFTTDTMGFVVMPNGFKVLGYNKEGQIAPIRIDRSTTKTGTATSNVEINGNINKTLGLDYENNEQVAYSTSMDVYDSVGKAHTVGINFGEKISYQVGDGPDATKGSLRNIQFTNEFLQGYIIGDDPAAAPIDSTQYDGKKQVGNLSTIKKVTSGGNLGAENTINENSLYAKFDDQGKFLGIVTAAQVVANVDEVKGEEFAAEGAKYRIKYSSAIATVSNFKLNLDVPEAEDVNLTLLGEVDNKPVDAFKKLTQYPAEADAKGKKVNGNAAGFLSNFNVSATGEVIGIFTNGEREVLGQLMLADFDNNVGLQKIGGNMFVDTVNSGTPKYGVPGSSSFGNIAPGALEMSNVDLSEQFTDMITTQRGFQANSRVITTTDEMLQELVSLKR